MTVVGGCLMSARAVPRGHPLAAAGALTRRVGEQAQQGAVVVGDPQAVEIADWHPAAQTKACHEFVIK